MASQGTGNIPVSRSLSGSQIAVLLCICTAAVSLRIIDAPLANLSAMAALALFCGSVLRHPAGILLPLAMRLLTDCLVHWKTGYGFFPSWPFDYSAYALIFAIGCFVKQKRYDMVMAGTIGSVIVYFVLSNFGVWLLWPDTYPRTVDGLIDCFAMAVPFARGTIIGNLIAAPVFFAAWNLLAAPNAKATASKDSAIAVSE